MKERVRAVENSIEEVEQHKKKILKKRVKIDVRSQELINRKTEFNADTASLKEDRRELSEQRTQVTVNLSAIEERVKVLNSKEKEVSRQE